MAATVAETVDGADASAGTLVSVVIPCYNGAAWLHECLASVEAQAWRPLELSAYDDASTDDSGAILERWRPRLEAAGISVRIGGSSCKQGPRGCGFAKNRAVEQSSGEFLCFLDADDCMQPERVASQLREACRRPRLERERLLVGCGVAREPPEAQARFSAWANSLVTEEELMRERFRECPLLMVTWFLHRRAYDEVGGFSEAGKGTPEDLIFFYEHCRRKGRLAKVPEQLVTYRAHENQTSIGSVSAKAIWDLRLAEIQEQLLDTLPCFSIWSAGRDGKRFYTGLGLDNRRKVKAFFDVDEKKLSSGGFFDKEDRRHVQIIHFSALSGDGASTYFPIIILVKRDLYPEFEENLASLKLRPGIDYWQFA